LILDVKFNCHVNSPEDHCFNDDGVKFQYKFFSIFGFLFKYRSTFCTPASKTVNFHMTARQPPPSWGGDHNFKLGYIVILYFIWWQIARCLKYVQDVYGGHSHSRLLEVLMLKFVEFKKFTLNDLQTYKTRKYLTSKVTCYHIISCRPNFGCHICKSSIFNAGRNVQKYRKICVDIPPYHNRILTF
jgi:hypothetical protein